MANSLGEESQAMIRYRQPLNDDKQIFRLVINELVPHSYKGRENHNTSYKSIHKDVKKRLYNGTTFVAASRRKNIFGFIHLIKKNDNLFIDMLAVDKSLQGKGWGGRLLNLAEQYGRNRGLNSAALYVDIMNGSAQRFYARNGYKLHNFVPHIQCYQLIKEL
jgi:ribosomal protein S18 acetylase RimI-like enzyme